MPHMIANATELVSSVTELVAHCQVCGVQWEVKSPNRDDAEGCSFCDAPKRAITVVSEKAGYGQEGRA
jgi:hypothetical protein